MGRIIHQTYLVHLTESILKLPPPLSNVIAKSNLPRNYPTEILQRLPKLPFCSAQRDRNSNPGRVYQGFRRLATAQINRTKSPSIGCCCLHLTCFCAQYKILIPTTYDFQYCIPKVSLFFFQPTFNLYDYIYGSALKSRFRLSLFHEYKTYTLHIPISISFESYKLLTYFKRTISHAKQPVKSFPRVGIITIFPFSR